MEDLQDRLGDRLNTSTDRAARLSCATVCEPCPVEAWNCFDTVDAPMRQTIRRRRNRLLRSAPRAMADMPILAGVSHGRPPRVRCGD